MNRIPHSIRLGIVAVAVVAFVPTVRAPLILAAALWVFANELGARRNAVGRSIDVAVDGARHRLPPTGGLLAVAGRHLEVERAGAYVVIDGRRLERGEGYFEGSSHVEVIR